jgi:hypothetical protein
VGSPTLDTSRARFGDLIAGGGGLVLLISLFLSWYSYEADGEEIPAVLGIPGNGWEALGFIDIILLLAALVAMGVAIARMAGAMPRMPVSPGLLVLALGVIATLLVIFRIIDIPLPDVVGATDKEVEDSLDEGEFEIGRSIGVFLALLAAAAVAVGGWLTWNEEGKPKPGGPGGPGPLGAGAGGYAQPGAQPGGYAQPPAAAQPAQPAQPVAPPPAQSAAPAQPAAGGQAADWYPDPRGEKRLRYWDGSQWTDHTAD